jgi:hypothetical protein
MAFAPDISKRKPVAVLVTVMVISAIFCPSTVVAVIIAVPGAMPFTRPVVSFTVAIVLLSENHLTDLLSESSWLIIAWSCRVRPIPIGPVGRRNRDSGYFPQIFFGIGDEIVARCQEKSQKDTEDGK